MNLTPHKLSAAELAALTPERFDLSNIFEDRDALMPPRGCLLVVMDGPETYAACAGLVPIAPKACEIRHFVVSYAYRGKGLGSRLMRALLSEARQAGYTRVVSNITPWCPEWRAFYKAHGFEFINEADEHNLAGTAAVELSLA